MKKGSSATNNPQMMEMRLIAFRQNTISQTWQINKTIHSVKSFIGLLKKEVPTNKILVKNTEHKLSREYLSLESWFNEVLLRFKQGAIRIDDDVLESFFLDSSVQVQENRISQCTSMAPGRNDQLLNKRLKSSQNQSFKPAILIGEGSFGQVLLATTCVEASSVKSKQTIVAIKLLNKCNMIVRNHAERVDIERQCLERADSPFVVSLFGSYQTSTHLLLIQEFCAGGEMYLRLERKGLFSNEEALFYSAECILALEHLHDLGIAYRDLKPENIMFDQMGHIKLVDFGLAATNCSKSSTGLLSYVGTSEYLSPEMILRRGHGYAVDWWALGMVLFEMITGLPPWYTENREKVMRSILRDPIPPSTKLNLEARDLLERLLIKSPTTRLGSIGGARSIKCHPYFSVINWNELEERRIQPPYIPELSNEFDTSYFDKSFTQRDICLDSIASEEDLTLIKRAEEKGMFQGFMFKKDILLH